MYTKCLAITALSIISVVAGTVTVSSPGITYDFGPNLISIGAFSQTVEATGAWALVDVPVGGFGVTPTAVPEWTADVSVPLIVNGNPVDWRLRVFYYASGSYHVGFWPLYQFPQETPVMTPARSLGESVLAVIPTPVPLENVPEPATITMIGAGVLLFFSKSCRRYVDRRIQHRQR